MKTMQEMFYITLGMIYKEWNDPLGKVPADKFSHNPDIIAD